jgi:large conductance mechanosensitive channel
MLKGFREFVAKGNVIDLAVGVIIGAAFGAVVDSLVKDVITPVLGMIGGIPDFSAWTAGSVKIGSFINAIIAFLLKAAGLYFFIVVPYNRFMRKPAVAAPPTPTELYLKEIRDLLAKRPA